MPRGEGSGLFYKPSPQPAGTGVEDIRQWCQREFDRIADVLGQGASQGLRLDTITVLPEKPQEGMLLYFAAGVAGSPRGVYEYAGGAWHKL